jgi:hypothetical protein
MGQVLDRVDVQHEHTDDKAAENAHKIGVDAQKRHHEDQGDHARQHQELDGRKAEGAQGVDFLVDLHGAELGGIGGAGATGHDDPGHDGAHDPDHGNADNGGDVDLGPELAERMAPTKARMSPTSRLMRETMGNASTPA